MKIRNGIERGENLLLILHTMRNFYTKSIEETD